MAGGASALAARFGDTPAELARRVASPGGTTEAGLQVLDQGGALNLLMLVWCGTKVERILGAGPLVLLYIVGAFTAAIAQWLASPMSPTPMIGASGAISAVIGAFALSFGEQKRLVKSPGLNRALNSMWLLAAWVVLQMMTGLLAGTQGYLLATPAHIGGFVAGLLLQRPLLLWQYRNA
jgi:membrane associated rhomboid family serine protease